MSGLEILLAIELAYWCNAHQQGNYVSIHSDKFKSREKKNEYY